MEEGTADQILREFLQYEKDEVRTGKRLKPNSGVGGEVWWEGGGVCRMKR